MGNNFARLKTENQINLCVWVYYFLINLSCCSAAAKGGMKKGKTSVGVLNLVDPGGCACKTNKPLQRRTSAFETEQKVITKILLYQNKYASFSKYMIFNTRWAGRSVDPINIFWKQSIKCISNLYSNLLLDPYVLSTVLHPSVSPDPFSWEKVVLSLRTWTWETGSCYVHFTAVFNVWVQLSRVSGCEL